MRTTTSSRRHVPLILVAKILAACMPAAFGAGAAGSVAEARPAQAPLRPVHTFSIVARDPKTGEIGAAVQSHYFSVGPIVPWAEAGVGAVATQSLVDVSYGPKGLDLMRQGRSASDALSELILKDDKREVRQVAMVDARGNAAAWTGPRCIEAAGQEIGAGSKDFSVQANLMANDAVWPAMAKAYRAATGDLADRMLAALEAGQKAGGDIRGQQSAAIIVVKPVSTKEPWKDRVFDLRVEDSPHPIEELKRLVRLQRAYRYEDQGDDFVAAGKMDEALKSYSEAARLGPEVPELLFWQAVSLFSADREAEAMPLFRTVFAADPNWAVLVPRLVAPGLLKADEEGLERIAAVAASAKTAPAPVKKTPAGARPGAKTPAKKPAKAPPKKPAQTRPGKPANAPAATSASTASEPATR